MLFKDVTRVKSIDFELDFKLHDTCDRIRSGCMIAWSLFMSPSHVPLQPLWAKIKLQFPFLSNFLSGVIANGLAGCSMLR